MAGNAPSANPAPATNELLVGAPTTARTLFDGALLGGARVVYGSFEDLVQSGVALDVIIVDDATAAARLRAV
ncbi:hypothetical protein ACSTII_00275, partial [Vibrio parahaemolyticus]